ncbi:MAG: hypothetical protein HY801_15195, partial [Candidatus Lindowbacteria bacterium]|nr:hypothetical protein [Candidatus Lindowbacteria bacterium]
DLRKARELARGQNSAIEAYVGGAYALMGMRTEAEQLREELLEKTKHAYVSPFALSALHFALGETEQGFAWLEKAIEDRDHWLCFIKINRMFNSVRTDPRFKRIIERIGAPES